MTSHRTEWRPHLYELVVVANFLIILAMTVTKTYSVILTLPNTFVIAGGSIVVQALIAIVIRIVIAAIRGNLRAYLDVIRSRAWIVESIRLVISATLIIHVYSWIKVSVPLLHPRLFDAELWQLDRTIFFGISPNIFFLNLFSNHYALRAVDLSYGNVFLFGITVAIAFFLSAASHRIRIAFITGHTFLWLIGAWLYMLIPSLGPAYRFPDVWMQYSRELETTQRLQAILWSNYSNVMRITQPHAEARPINILYGIAAFPSLHVAFQTFIFLWFRKLWKGGELLFGIFVFVIFFGALITGWHYLIDLIAGMFMAWGVWAVTSRRYRIDRWAHLSELL